VIGDSFFASSHQITAYLEDLSRAAGTLPDGERYRDNSRLTANALAFGGNGIYDEYEAGVTEATVKFVIMNGGGVDVLASTCAPNSSCPVLEAAATAARDLFAQMVADGVQQVVYAFYPDPIDAAIRAQMDTLRPLAQSACAASPVPCAWLDLRPTFAGHYDEYVQADGLNPTAAGSQASAEAIAALMRDRCIAQ
jgi:lysophospholipase L1-like esterase